MMISLLAVAALLLCSCDKNGGGETPATGHVTVDKESISVESSATEETITVTADCDWGVASEDVDWLTVSPGGGIAGTTTVRVSIKENGTGKVRESALVFSYGRERLRVPVTQNYVIAEDGVDTPEGYRLVWRDEFYDTADGMPDSDKWWYETAEPGWVNNELQTYVAGKAGNIVTAQVSGGTLKIRAIKDGDRVYSARINTTEYWTYGYFEARMKLPKGLGTWPAFWMMPEVYTGWPGCGELDIMEHVGADLNQVSSSVHCQSYYHVTGNQPTKARYLSGATDDFHVYALEWTEDLIRTYVDGEVLLEYNPEEFGSRVRNHDSWPFYVPFGLKLNLAWGGDWGGYKGIDESCLPQTFEIDYVRVFQKQ